ncbi:Zinc/iron permease [Artemisia annua]|uniref:Zinc/iron permease n=1 Tax=Artemisia annua TaxID=35608 RepID=A0A2U1NFL5_ARTAN|nr:Zinc/iron permease [Artemisia annua]
MHGKEIICHAGFTILLILVLCFHSVIEGIYIGEATSNAEAWGYIRQIIPYNIFASLAMGITILSLISKRPFLSIAVYAFAFGISNTIGIAIGIAVNVFAHSKGTALDWIYAISTGIACGGLMYVAIHHIICKGFKPQEGSNSDTQFIKFLALLLGVGIIAIVMTWD